MSAVLPRIRSFERVMRIHTSLVTTRGINAPEALVLVKGRLVDGEGR